MQEIFERRSIRRYENRQIEPEKIELLLRAAMAAPSARDAKEWAFIVVTDRDKILQLSQVHAYTGCAADAPLVIVPVAEGKNLFWQQDLGASVQNLLLEAQTLGLGGVWMGIAPMKERMEGVRKILQLPAHVRPFAIIAIGYPKEKRPPRGLWETQKIHFNGWD